MGSNLGDGRANLAQAIHQLAEAAKILEVSSIYLTEAWGLVDQDPFYNQAILIATTMSAEGLLMECQLIANSFPDKKGERWGPRYIDMDIIFYDEEIVDTDLLKIPHPRMHLRNFVLIPLLEIIPDWLHPILHKTVEELYMECRDELEVILLEST